MKKEIKPNFVVIGQPKAGTTALYEMLSQHPEIFIIDQGGYFYPDNIQGENTKPLSLDEYFELFKEIKDEKAIGDSSEGCFYSDISPKKIKELNPEMKIIIILREPISWLRSAYQQGYRNLLEKRPIEKAIMSEDYLDKINYEKYLKEWIKSFPKKNIKMIVHEDFKENNKKTTKDIFDFLEVDKNFVAKPIRTNPSRILRFKSVQFFIDSIGIKREKLKEILPGKFWNFCKKLGYKEEKIPIPEKTKNKIKEIAKEEVKKVNQLVKEKEILPKNKDLKKKWGYDKL